MIKQRPRSALTSGKAARRDATKKSYIDRLDSRNGGILRMTDPRSGAEREIKDHQFIAAYNLWQMDKDTPLEQGRKAGMVVMHGMGLGKSITSLVQISGIHEMLRDRSSAIHVIVCTKSLLTEWFDRATSWLDLPEGSVFMAERQSAITAEVLRRTRILIVTRDVLVQAYKSFMYWNETGEKYQTKGGKWKERGAYCRGVGPGASERRKATYKRRLPPVHPLFAYMAQRVGDGKFTFATVVVDEIHGCSNPKRWSGHVIGLLCEDAVYTSGSTGTPVRAWPSQVADLARTLRLRPVTLQDRKAWSIRGSKDTCLRTTTVKLFQDTCVDRVSKDMVEDLVPIKWVRLSYDPFIGRLRRGGYDREQQRRHDARLESAQTQTAFAMKTNTYRGAFDTWLWQAMTTMVQFTFDGTLGMYGAAAFEKEPEIYYRLSSRQPSETVRLIYRMLRDRQSKGHPRIVVYSASTVMLTILRNYVSKRGRCGKLFLYTGALQKARERSRMIKSFLSRKNPQGVLFLSDAGKEGVDICPGCDTMFIVGDLPWNSADIDQVQGRIHRMTQDQNVEIVTFEPRRSVISAKLSQHIDKRERLERAICDEDFSKFDGGPAVPTDPTAQCWKLHGDITMGLSSLREVGDGNYKLTKQQAEIETEWKEACANADLVGEPRPEMPEAIIVPESVRAKAVKLPPIGWPKESAVEPSSDAEDYSDSSSAEEEEDAEDEEHEAARPLTGRVRKARATKVRNDDADDKELQALLANSKAAQKRRKIDEQMELRMNVLQKRMAEDGEAEEEEGEEEEDEDSDAEGGASEDEEEDEEEEDEEETDEEETEQETETDGEDDN